MIMCALTTGCIHNQGFAAVLPLPVEDWALRFGRGPSPILCCISGSVCYEEAVLGFVLFCFCFDSDTGRAFEKVLPSPLPSVRRFCVRICVYIIHIYIYICVCVCKYI